MATFDTSRAVMDKRSPFDELRDRYGQVITLRHSYNLLWKGAYPSTYHASLWTGVQGSRFLFLVSDVDIRFDLVVIHEIVVREVDIALFVNGGFPGQG